MQSTCLQVLILSFTLHGQPQLTLKKPYYLTNGNSFSKRLINKCGKFTMDKTDLKKNSKRIMLIFLKKSMEVLLEVLNCLLVESNLLPSNLTFSKSLHYVSELDLLFRQVLYIITKETTVGGKGEIGTPVFFCLGQDYFRC
jgi:hypothetical protein